MRTASGLERLLLAETNVSDLIQFFASEDRKPLVTLLGVEFDDVRREDAFGRKRADLVLRRAGRPVAAIEVKVGHAFSDEQRQAYEDWANANSVPLLVLFSLDPAPADLTMVWRHYPLLAIFEAWSSVRKSAVAFLAARVASVLREWGEVIDGVRRPMTQPGALTYAEIDNIALLRVISRELSAAQRAAGFNARAGVTSGGGNPLAQSWTEIHGVNNVYFIADARFEEHRVHLRFGVDGNRANANEVWRVAHTLDDAITATAFAKFLRAAQGEDDCAPPQFEALARPQAHGNWSAAIAAGKVPNGTNPGFLRDGLARLECGVRFRRADLNSWSLEWLMNAVHEHLRAAWTAAGQDGGFPAG